MAGKALLPSSEGSGNGLAEAPGLGPWSMGISDQDEANTPRAGVEPHYTNKCFEMISRPKYGSQNYKDSRGNNSLSFDLTLMTLGKQKMS